MRLVVVLCAAVVTLTGCNSSDDEPKADNPLPSDESSSTALFEPMTPAASESVDPFAPNLGDTALKVGQTRDGRGTDTTLHEVRYPFPPGEYRVPEAGMAFLGLRLEQCLADDAEPALSTYNGEWSAVTRSGTEFTGSGSSWNDWPAPKFPETVEMIPGRCLKGWIAMEVPVGTKFQSLLWRAETTTPIAEWLPR